MSVEQIIEKVQSYSADHVCLTGGEPLAQPESLKLMKALCDLGYKVSLETSGSLSCAEVDPRVKKVIDVKTPDSGAAESFVMENIGVATSHDEFKFVICSERDFDWAENFVTQNALAEKFPLLYSPSFGKIEEKWLAKKILSKSSKARLQLQMHKYIWSPDTRGV